MVGWLGTGVVAPVTTFAVKFGLFSRAGDVTDALGNVIAHSNIAVNGWGIVSCLLIGSYLMQILKEVMATHEGYSFTKQCYDGFCKIVPYVIAYGVCYFLNGVLSQVMFCLAILIVCKAAAIPLNPLPKWRFEKTGKEDYSGFEKLITEVVDKLRKKEGEN